MSRLNQDALENFFSIIRSRGGGNRNPTARTFRGSFRINVMNALMKPPTSANCEVDEDEFVDFSNTMSVDNIEDSTSSEEETEESTHFTGSDSSESNAESDVEDCALAYFSGYVCHKLIKKFNCKICESRVILKDSVEISKKELYIQHKFHTEYSTELIIPNSNVIGLVKICLKYFRRIFGSDKSIVNPKSKIKSAILNKTTFGVICQEDTHTEYFLDTLINTRLHKECKWSEKVSSKKKKEKMKILKNL